MLTSMRCVITEAEHIGETGEEESDIGEVSPTITEFTYSVYPNLSLATRDLPTNTEHEQRSKSVSRQSK